MPSSDMPSLISFVQKHLTTLYEGHIPEGQEEANFNDLLQTSFDSLLSSDAQIIVNDKQKSRDQFKNDIGERAGGGAVAKISLEWKQIIEVPAESGDDVPQSGLVAGTFTITRQMKFRIRAAPAQNYHHVVFQARVEKDPKVSKDGNNDQRRIVHLAITEANEAAKIQLH